MGRFDAELASLANTVWEKGEDGSGGFDAELAPLANTVWDKWGRRLGGI